MYIQYTSMTVTATQQPKFGNHLSVAVNIIIVHCHHGIPLISHEHYYLYMQMLYIYACILLSIYFGSHNIYLHKMILLISHFLYNTRML